MEQIKKMRSKIKARIIIYVIILVILLTFFILEITNIMPIKRYGNEDYTDYIKSGLLGMSSGLMFSFIYQLIKNIKALKNDDSIRRLFNRKTDERRKAIEERLGRLSFGIIMIALMIAIVVSSYLNFLVFITLLIVLFFCAVLRITLYLIYSKLI